MVGDNLEIPELQRCFLTQTNVFIVEKPLCYIVWMQLQAGVSRKMPLR